VLDHGVVVHHGPAAALAADEALVQSLAGASAEKWDLDKSGASPSGWAR
jgi:branched-chain amino acid transport system ATP-binding protein